MAKAGGGRGGRPGGGGGGLGDGTMGPAGARVVGTGANRRVIIARGQGPTIGPDRIPGQTRARGGTGPTEQAARNRKPPRAASQRTAPAAAPAQTVRYGPKPVRSNALAAPRSTARSMTTPLRKPIRSA